MLNQAVLARRIGISTTPLREALRRLAQQGLVELGAHRDARVAPLDAAEARDLVELRQDLDPLAAGLVAQRRTAADLAEMAGSLARLERCPRTSPAQLADHRRFPAALYRASHNAVLVETLDGLWDESDRYRRHALRAGCSDEELGQRAEEHRLRGLLLAHSALTQVVTFVLRPTTAHRAIELDVPTAWLGALTASFAVVPLLLAVPSGQATDRFGERRVMLAGAVLLLSAVLLASGAAGLVTGSVVLGNGPLLPIGGQQAAVANTAGPGRFDTAFGHYTSGSVALSAVSMRPSRFRCRSRGPRCSSSCSASGLAWASR